MKRRDLLKVAPLVAGATALPTEVLAQEPSISEKDAPGVYKLITVTTTYGPYCTAKEPWDEHRACFSEDTRAEVSFHGGDFDGIVLEQARRDWPWVIVEAVARGELVRQGNLELAQNLASPESVTFSYLADQETQEAMAARGIAVTKLWNTARV